MLQDQNLQEIETELSYLSHNEESDESWEQALIIPDRVEPETKEVRNTTQSQLAASHTIIDIDDDDDEQDADDIVGIALDDDFDDMDDDMLSESAPVSLLPVRRSAMAQSGDVVQRDLLQQYFREVGRHPILTREQEHDLAMVFVKTQDRSIAYRLITSNLRLVVKIAKEYQSNIASLMDLIQEGNVGLIKGVAKYDPTKGVRLGSYAQWWIRAYMLKYLVNNARLVKVGTTQAQRKLFFSLNKEKNRLKAAGFKPEPGAIAKNLGVQVKDVKEMEKRLSRHDLSMDMPLGDEQKSSIGDLMVSDDSNAEDKMIQGDLNHRFKQHLDQFSKTLKDREQILWDKRLMADERLTLREIGDLFGLTRERARQIEKNMLDRLRSYLQQELPELNEFDFAPTMQVPSHFETAVC